MSLRANNEAATMKETFLHSMQYLWPDGVRDRHQWRDVIRVYCMGWFEALCACGRTDLARQWRDEFAPLAAGDWWPDGSWQWWEEE